MFIRRVACRSKKPWRFMLSSHMVFFAFHIFLLKIQAYSHSSSCYSRSLAGYSLWGHKELDMTEQLTLLLGQDQHPTNQLLPLHTELGLHQDRRPPHHRVAPYSPYPVGSLGPDKWLSKVAPTPGANSTHQCSQLQHHKIKGTQPAWGTRLKHQKLATRRDCFSRPQLFTYGHSFKTRRHGWSTQHPKANT